jgi:hypothetical protein
MDSREEIGMEAAFNHDFYTTSATVIPVLYLALSVQGTLVGNLLTHLESAIHTMRTTVPDTLPKQWALIIAQYTALIVYSAASLIVVGAAGGEILAIIALDHRSDNTMLRNLVLAAVIGLVVILAADPLWKLSWNWVRYLWASAISTWRFAKYSPKVWRQLGRATQEQDDQVENQDDASGKQDEHQEEHDQKGGEDS